MDPVRAILSSTFNSDFKAEKCIDGDTEGPDAVPGVDGSISVAKCQIFRTDQISQTNADNSVIKT